MIESVKGAIRKALTEDWHDAANARKWSEDILLTGVQRCGGGRGYDSPKEAADQLADFAARAAIVAHEEAIAALWQRWDALAEAKHGALYWVCDADDEVYFCAAEVSDPEAVDFVICNPDGADIIVENPEWIMPAGEFKFPRPKASSFEPAKE